jgi:immunity protein 48 of polymorphic toxin system
MTSDAGEMTRLRREVAAMASGLFELAGIPFERTTELQRQVLAAFVFGMIYAAGRLAGRTQPEVHALALGCLLEVFRYSHAQSAAFCQQLVDASSSPAEHDTTNAIIHRGIDGHRQWAQGESDELRANVTGVLRDVGALG